MSLKKKDTDATVKFKGLLLECRNTDGDIKGKFAAPKDPFQLRDCSGDDSKSAITHKDGTDKNLPVSFTWTCPEKGTYECL